MRHPTVMGGKTYDGNRPHACCVSGSNFLSNVRRQQFVVLIPVMHGCFGGEEVFPRAQ